MIKQLSGKGLLKACVVLCCAASLSACSTHLVKQQVNETPAPDFVRTSAFYDSITHKETIDVARLNLFFTRMPKGGDIHHHFTGSIYAETYLDWVASKHWYIDQCSLRIVKSKSAETATCPALNVKQLLQDNASYRRLLSLWSDKDYANHFHDQPAPDSNFFNTFSYFGPISNAYMKHGLALIKQRAVKENINYIETMYTRVGVKAADYFSAAKIDRLNQRLRQAPDQQAVNSLLDEIVTAFKQNNRFKTALNNYLQMIQDTHAGIDDDHFSMRFQTYAARVLDPVQVFADLYSGYVAADTSPLVVGVNIVAPENNHVALSDYTLHMRMYNYLLHQYPDVHRALHAGELTLGMVRPRDLSFHIRQARSIAHAERIGHGVDLPYEDHSLALLNDLKDKAVIEINLTSNQFILGVEKQTHPYLIYAAYGVPMIISTDDSGVSRNNLSNEYMLLASRYKPDYALVKTYAYNSIRYSFLSPADKKKHLAILDQEFTRFEKEIAALATEMSRFK